MDSFFTTLNDIAKDIKVGVQATFSGEAGLEVDSLELYVDGFRIGEAGFGRPSAGKKLWELEYTFKGHGKRSLILTSKANGEVISNRFHSFNVAAKEEVKPEGKTKFPVKVVRSDIDHVVRWNNRTIGICFHYDAGRPSNDPTSVLEMGVKNGYTYWSLMRDGTVFATTELNEHGYHNGMYKHKNHLGVEVSGCGKLTKIGDDFWPWYALKNGVPRPGEKPWPKDDIRYFEGSKTQVKGHYAKFTEAQEKAMVGLVQYVKDRCPGFSIDNVVGHDTCMAEMGWYGEKQDPGGSLSMSIEDFREYLKKVIV